MRNPIRLLMIAASAIMVLAIAAGPAAARIRVEVVPSGAIRATASRLTFESEAANVICDVTMNGTIARLITKERLADGGTITEIRTNNARNNFGTATRCSGLPGMKIAFGGITGTLPDRISGALLLVGNRAGEPSGGFLVGANAIFFEILCLYKGLIGAGSTTNPVRTMTILPGDQIFNTVSALPGSAACPEVRSVRLNGTFTLSPEIRINLLER